MMVHKTTKAQIFYILEGIDYSKSWDDVEYDLNYTLGDHRFESSETYDLVRRAAMNLWVTLNGHLASDGNMET